MSATATDSALTPAEIWRGYPVTALGYEDGTMTVERESHFGSLINGEIAGDETHAECIGDSGAVIWLPLRMIPGFWEDIETSEDEDADEFWDEDF